MADLLFLTELLGLPVFDLKRRRLGRVKDAALVPRVDRARVDRFLVGGGWAWLTVRYDQVASVGLEGLFLNDEQLTPYHDDEYMLRIGQDLLDQQIIDAQGRKVVRVSDVTFEIHRANRHMELRVREVDVGLRSVLRRVAQGVVPPSVVRRVQQPIPPRSIPWALCNIVEPDPQRRLRLNISYGFLEDMHPADIADIVEDLGPEERGAIFETIDEEVAAEALSEVEPETQASILESLEPEKAAEILEEMAPDEAADALGELTEEAAGEILEEMEPASQTEVTELLEFEPDSAGGLMNTDFLSVSVRGTVADALSEVRRHEDLLDTVSAIYLVDSSEALVGVVPLGRLLFGNPDQPLAMFTVEPLQSVPADEAKDRVAERFDKYNLLSLPVVDPAGRLVGVITADDIISALRDA
jgi:CBS domain-containing protein/sporulation protein YlmC with PRC-barrel domain